MKYTLTKANPDADTYPAQTSQTVNDPIEDEVNKNVFNLTVLAGSGTLTVNQDNADSLAHVH